MSEQVVRRLRYRLARQRPLVDAVAALHAAIDPRIDRGALSPEMRDLLEAWDEYLRITEEG